MLEAAARPAVPAASVAAPNFHQALPPAAPSAAGAACSSVCARVDLTAAGEAGVLLWAPATRAALDAVNPTPTGGTRAGHGIGSCDPCGPQRSTLESSLAALFHMVNHCPARLSCAPLQQPDTCGHDQRRGGPPNEADQPGFRKTRFLFAQALQPLLGACGRRTNSLWFPWAAQEDRHRSKLGVAQHGPGGRAEGAAEPAAADLVSPDRLKLPCPRA